MKKPIQSKNDQIDSEKKLFESLLKMPGARKAKQGVILESPEGSFHVRGIIRKIDGIPESAQFLAEFCTESEVLRAIDIKNSHDYLLKRRAESIADNPRLVRQISYAKNRWESRGRPWSLTSYYNKLNKDAKEYIDNIPKIERNKFSKLAYGRVPMLQPNGICFRSLVGDVVMVSDTLHYFLYFYTLASLGCYYGLDANQRVHALIISLRIMKGVESLDFEMDPREKLPAKIRSEVLQDVGWMIQFTFAHEFAHFTLGHLDAEPAAGEHEIIFAHGLEYEADSHAVCLAGRGSFRASKLAWGSHQVFLAFHAMERVGRIRQDFPDLSLSKTHPDPIDRIRSIQSLKIKYNTAGDDILDDAVAAVDNLVDMTINYIDGNENILSTYGSIYVPGFDVGKARDRIDF